jgi:regulatory protein
MSNEAVSFANVQFSAMSLLALREHSAWELEQKLQKKFDDCTLVAQVITDLTARDLQNDERFAEAFVKMRIRQGKGPVRIQYDLREKGIAADLIAIVLDDSNSLWLGLAQEVRIRRFGEKVPCDHKDKAKQMRFLQYRGFSSAHIQQIFRHDRS